MILVDTSLWLRFFRGEEAGLVVKSWIGSDGVLVHPYVKGELLLGGLSQRNASLMGSLPECEAAILGDTLDLIRSEDLAGKGIGFVDAALLTSALDAQAAIATLDESLAECARRLGIYRDPGAP